MSPGLAGAMAGTEPHGRGCDVGEEGRGGEDGEEYSRPWYVERRCRLWGGWVRGVKDHDGPALLVD